ncbi:MAG: YbaN family protein [Marinicella sp.]
MRRSFWLALGLISLVIGIAGVLLPLLPTTPFILLSAAAFAQSSPKLHAWLLNHPRWGLIIQNWQDGGRIDRKSKAMALGVILLTPVLSWILSVPLWIIWVQLLVLSGVSIYILTRPS